MRGDRQIFHACVVGGGIRKSEPMLARPEPSSSMNLTAFCS